MVLRFLFRCGRCRQVTTLKVQWINQAAATIACPGCKASYSLPYDKRRDPSEPLYREQIMRLARQHKLDPATASSVREGIMTLEQAKSPVKIAPPRKENTGGLQRQVAMGMGLVLAAVAITILAWPEAGLPPSAEAVAPSRQEEQSVPSPEPPPPAPAMPATYSADPLGQLTQVWGPDPGSVLVSLCGHPASGAWLKPAFIAPDRPPSPGSRVGLARDMRDLGAFQSVTIRRDGRTGRWYAGDGRTPIVMKRHETFPLEGADPI